MTKYRTIQWNADGSETRKDHATIEAMAAEMGIDAADAEWAIEEHGRVDTGEHTGWQPESEDEEHPQAEAPEAE